MTRNKGHKIVTVELSCGHRPTFYDKPPKVKDFMLCGECGDSVTVVRNDLNQWTARCITCAYVSAHGLYGRLSAERAAALHRHRKNNSQHIVEIRDADGNLHYRFDNNSQYSLDNVTEA